jgi:hypothetical protein
VAHIVTELGYPGVAVLADVTLVLSLTLILSKALRWTAAIVVLIAGASLLFAVSLL